MQLRHFRKNKVNTLDTRGLLLTPLYYEENQFSAVNYADQTMSETLFSISILKNSFRKREHLDEVIMTFSSLS